MSVPLRHTAARTARRAGRWLRYLPDRLLHAQRRRTAARRIAAMVPVRRVLVMCHGNICRSPYAERALRARLSAASRPDILVSSAGFIGPDRPAPSTAREAAADRGVDLGGHRSRLLAPDELLPGTLVLVMNQTQMEAIARLARPGVEAVWLGDLDLDPVDRRAITDPVDQPRVVFDQVYDRIDRCVAYLTALLAGNGPTA